MRLREVLEEDDARAERGLLNTLRSEHIQLKVFPFLNVLYLTILTCICAKFLLIIS